MCEVLELRNCLDYVCGWKQLWMQVNGGKCGRYGKYCPNFTFFHFSVLWRHEVSRVSVVSLVSLVSIVPTLFFSISLSLEAMR